MRKAKENNEENSLVTDFNLTNHEKDCSLGTDIFTSQKDENKKEIIIENY
jgi:hypothetical protein